MTRRARVGALTVLAVVSTGLLGACTQTLTTQARAGCDGYPSSVSDGDPTMLPGVECMSCHHEFTAAGTVFTTSSSTCEAGHEGGASVEILDGTGATAFTLTTNGAGNFYTREPLPMPFRVRVTGSDGTTATMLTPQTSGDCASCHRLPPANAAPGRVALTLRAATPMPTPSLDAGVADAL